MIPAELWTIIIGIVASLVASLGVASSRQVLKGLTGQEDETIEDRVKRLTKSLREATALIGTIEGEIKARSNLVTRLQEDIDQYNQLVELKKPEVEAVAQLLRGELQREARSSLWKGFAINFLFFALGAGVSWIINIVTK